MYFEDSLTFSGISDRGYAIHFENISGHSITYEDAGPKGRSVDADRRWSCEIVCNVMGYFTDFASTLSGAKEKARAILREYGRENF